MIGLIMRKDWARKLYILNFFIVQIIFFPIVGWSYASPIASLFNTLGTMVAGALVLIFIIPDLYKPIFNQDK